MTFPCYVLGKGSSYTYIKTHMVEDDTTVSTVAKDVKGLVLAYYRCELGVEIELYKVSLNLSHGSPFNWISFTVFAALQPVRYRERK